MDIIKSDLELIHLQNSLLTDKPASDNVTLFEEMPILLDAGEETMTQNQLAQVVHALSREQYTFLGRGANSVCYKIILPGKHTEDGEIIIKKAVLNKGRTNADVTFAEEARQLTILSRIGIPNMPSLIGRFKYRINYYLLSRFVPGVHPDPLRNPFRPIHLDRLFKILFLMDRSGFVHYDLQASNILLTEEDVGFIDFEFAGQINLLATYHPKQQELYNDYNTSNNPYFPMRSTLCNFEFRTLYGYLRNAPTRRDAFDFFRLYLTTKAFYHKYLFDHLSVIKDILAGEIGQVSCLSTHEVITRLHNAIEYERTLAGVLAKHDHRVLTVEYIIMKYRYLLFNRDFNNWPVNLDRIYFSASRIINTFFQHSCRTDDSATMRYFSGAIHLLNRLHQKQLQRRGIA